MEYWSKELSPYPQIKQLLTTLIEEEVLHPVDYYFARSCLAKISEESAEKEELLLFFSYLMAASRAGHLCVKVEGRKLYPPIEKIFPLNSSLDDLEEMIMSGSLNANIAHFIKREENRFYINRNFVFEQEVIDQVVKIVSNKKDDIINSSILTKYNSEQQSGILTALSAPFSIITGGPGTGKTYTAIGIVKEFINQTQKERPLKIAVAAPTGKAASKLSVGLQKAIDTPFTCQTLHTLLSIKRASDFVNYSKKIHADLLIIDECSMIDLRLFSALLKGVEKETTLVLLGDVHQLPAVESGSLFADLIDSNLVPVTRLNTCVRCESPQILNFAQGVQEGNMLVIQNALNDSQDDLKILPLFSEQSAMPYFWVDATKKLFSPFHENVDVEKLLHQADQFRLLSPLRKGMFGVEQLNRFFYNHYLDHLPETGYFVIPIIISRNDATTGLSNGDTGVLVRHVDQFDKDLPFGSRDYALFPFKTKDASYVKFDAALLPKYEYAYVLSIHKSQGSEYQDVGVILPPGSERFGRELLYTAVTRAKTDVTIYAESGMIEKNIHATSRKFSSICQKLQHIKEKSYINE